MKWRQYLPQVLNSINLKRGINRLSRQILDYFTRKIVLIPQNLPNFYKFTVGQKVYIDISPVQRKDLSFNYSLAGGKMQATQPSRLPSTDDA